MEKQTYLTFFLGNEIFAINVESTIEVLEKQQITKVPHAPTHILGIINFRGEILPVVDTRVKFNLSATDYDEKVYIIILEIKTETELFEVAMIADSVKDVIEISKDEIKPIPEMGINYNAKYINGIVKKNDSFILLLQVEKIFSFSDTEITNSFQVSEKQ